MSPGNVATLPPRHVDDEDLPAIGSKVTHSSLGEGLVTAHLHRPAGAIEVDFGGTAGTRKLLAQYAPLIRSDRTGEKLLVSDGEKFDSDVMDEIRKLEVREAAREVMRTRGEPEAPPFDAGTLGELLSLPAEPPMRVEGLVPSDASVLVSAMRKTGKTVVCLNLARALITGEDFLGRFGVRPIDGTVALLNYEVSRGTITRWADEVGIDRDRFYIVNLRGRRNPLTHPEDRAKLVADLRARGTQALMVDPFGRAYTGKSQNDSGEVGSWLVDLDMFTRAEVGATDLLLTAHAGWNGERTRGSSALEDWADSIVTLTTDDNREHRFLRAMGRDVEVDEDRLDFDPSTRHLTLAGVGSRKESKDADKMSSLAVLVVAAAREEPGASGRRITELIRGYDEAPSFQDVDVRNAARLAVRQRLLRQEPGSKRRILHYALTPSAGGPDA